MGEYDDAVHADCLHEEGGGVGGGGEGDGWAVGRELSSALWKVVAPVETRLYRRLQIHQQTKSITPNRPKYNTATVQKYIDQHLLPSYLVETDAYRISVEGDPRVTYSGARGGVEKAGG